MGVDSNFNPGRNRHEKNTQGPTNELKELAKRTKDLHHQEFDEPEYGDKSDLVIKLDHARHVLRDLEYELKSRGLLDMSNAGARISVKAFAGLDLEDALAAHRIELDDDFWRDGLRKLTDELKKDPREWTVDPDESLSSLITTAQYTVEALQEFIATDGAERAGITADVLSSMTSMLFDFCIAVFAAGIAALLVTESPIKEATKELVGAAIVATGTHVRNSLKAPDAKASLRALDESATACANALRQTLAEEGAQADWRKVRTLAEGLITRVYLAERWTSFMRRPRPSDQVDYLLSGEAALKVLEAFSGEGGSQEPPAKETLEALIKELGKATNRTLRVLSPILDDPSRAPRATGGAASAVDDAF